MAINEINTPTQKDKECILIFATDSLPIETKLKTFNEITGNTHGIRLRIKPPINAKMIACINERDELLSCISIPESIMKF